MSCKATTSAIGPVIGFVAILSVLSVLFALFSVPFVTQAAAQEEAVEATAEAETPMPNAEPDIAYLEANKAKEGVIIRPSGLQIRILRSAEGDLVSPGGTAVVHYEGRLVDGRIFDSSYSRGQPAQFPVDGVIRGWSEALILMQVGAMWELVIPADIAYGDEGAPSGGIPPGATLIFKVELLDAM